MLERTLSLALAVLVPLTAACTTLQSRDYAPGDIPVPDAKHRIVAVTRTSGERVAFDREVEGRAALAPLVEQEAVLGPVDGQAVRVNLSDASAISVEEKRDAVGRTVLLVGGIGAAAFLVVGLLTFNMDMNLGGGGY